MQTHQTPGQFVSSRGHADLGQGFNQVQGRGVYISFQWDEIRLSTIDIEKNGKRMRRLRLMKQPIGDPNTSASSYITEKQAAEMYPAEWEYFNKHGDMPETGTAISELPGISNSHVQIMQLSGLRSIEDILSVSEEVINSIGYEGRFVHNVALEWDKRRKDASDITDYAEVATSIRAAEAAQRNRADHLQAENQQLTVRLEALERMMNSGNGGGNNMGSMQPTLPTVSRDEGPDIDSTPNPLADGDGTLDDDPLND